MELIVKKASISLLQARTKTSSHKSFLFCQNNRYSNRCSKLTFPLIHNDIIFRKRQCFIFLGKSQVNFSWGFPFAVRHNLSPAFDMFEIRGVICPTYHLVTFLIIWYLISKLACKKRVLIESILPCPVFETNPNYICNTKW